VNRPFERGIYRLIPGGSRAARHDENRHAEDRNDTGNCGDDDARARDDHYDHSGPTNCAVVIAGIVWPPSWRVVCAGARSGLLGSTDSAGVPTLFVWSNETAASLRIVALHESGHAWDLAKLDRAEIVAWCAARGCDAPRFFTGGASVHEPGGAEDSGRVVECVPQWVLRPLVPRAPGAERRAVRATGHARRVPRLTSTSRDQWPSGSMLGISA
jgi:hypothetical protein